MVKSKVLQDLPDPAWPDPPPPHILLLSFSSLQSHWSPALGILQFLLPLPQWSSPDDAFPHFFRFSWSATLSGRPSLPIQPKISTAHLNRFTLFDLTFLVFLLKHLPTLQHATSFIISCLNVCVAYWHVTSGSGVMCFCFAHYWTPKASEGSWCIVHKMDFSKENRDVVG